MSVQRKARLSTERLAAYAEGALDPQASADVEANLAGDTYARARLEQVHAIRTGLAGPVPELDAIDLRRNIQKALQERAAEAPAWRAFVRPLGLAAAAAAALCVAYIAVVPAGPAPEFRARGGPAPASDAQRWAGIRVYRASTKSKITVLQDGAVLARGEPLVFSYTNLGPRPFSHVMIFARDAREDVHWYYPAHEIAGTDPRSLAIQQRANELLPELISHDYAPGSLSVHALFSRRALSVSEIERQLQAALGQLLKIPDAYLQTLQLEVAR
jgi:hypothetical protein